MEPINLLLWWDWYWNPSLISHYWSNSWVVLSLISFVGVPITAAWLMIFPNDSGNRDPITVGDLSLIVLIWFILTIFSAPIAVIAGFLAAVLFWENVIYPGLKKLMSITVIPGKEEKSHD